MALERRRGKPVPQRLIARAMGVSPSTVTAWEIGKQRPTRDAQSKLARLYGVTPEWIMEGGGAAQNGAQATVLREIPVEYAARRGELVAIADDLERRAARLREIAAISPDGDAEIPGARMKERIGLVTPRHKRATTQSGSGRGGKKSDVA